jgi:hypothetical protein
MGLLSGRSSTTLRSTRPGARLKVGASTITRADLTLLASFHPALFAQQAARNACHRPVARPGLLSPSLDQDRATSELPETTLRVN